MKMMFFEQKNYLSNNNDSKLSGIYNVIANNSDIELTNSLLSTTNFNFLLNNTNFINNNKTNITINNLNNSNIAFNQGSYICYSQNNGSLIQFACPKYYDINNDNNTVLFPTSTHIFSKNILSNGISSFFSTFKDTSIYDDLIFQIENNQIKTISANNNKALLYNQYEVNGKFSISSFILDILPKNLNGYSYTFNFLENNTCHIEFKDFYGGKIKINFKNNLYSSFKFENCKNIEINGEDHILYLDIHTYYMFYFINCFNIQLNKIKHNYYKHNSYYNLYNTVSGNIRKYNYNDYIYGISIFKNSNAYIRNCTYQQATATSYTVQSIIACNSKILLEDCNSSTGNTKTNLFIDQFSLVSNNCQLSSVQAYIEDCKSANITYNIDSDKYMNNGLYNHMHTDYLIKTNYYV